MLIRQIFIEDGKVFGVADNDRRYILIEGKWEPYGWAQNSYEREAPLIDVKYS